MCPPGSLVSRKAMHSGLTWCLVVTGCQKWVIPNLLKALRDQPQRVEARGRQISSHTKANSNSSELLGPGCSQAVEKVLPEGEGKGRLGQRELYWLFLRLLFSPESVQTIIQEEKMVMSQMFLAFSSTSHSARFFKVICVWDPAYQSRPISFAFVLLSPKKALPPSLKGHNGLISSIQLLKRECGFNVRRKILTGLYPRHNQLHALVIRQHILLSLHPSCSSTSLKNMTLAYKGKKNI